MSSRKSTTQPPRRTSPSKRNANPKSSGDGFNLSTMYTINKQLVGQYLEFAKLDYSNRQYASAVRNVNEAIKIHPKNMELLLWRSLCFIASGKNEEAIVDLTELVTTDWKHEPQAFILLALCQKRKGDLPAAIRALTKGISLNEFFVDAYVARGEAYLQQQAYEKSLSDFEQCLHCDPKALVGHCGCASAFMGMGNISAALQTLSLAIEKDPTYERAYVQRANIYLGQNAVDSALEDLNSVIQLNYDVNKATRLTCPRALLLRGRIGILVRKFDDAVRDFTVALTIDPNMFACYYFRGIAYFELDEFQQAYTDFDFYQKCDPNAYCIRENAVKDHVLSYKTLCKAGLLLQAGDAESCSRSLDTLSKFGEDVQARVYSIRAHALFLMQRYESCSNDYRRYMKVMGYHKHYADNVGIAQGLISAHHGNYKVAEKQFNWARNRTSFACRCFSLLKCYPPRATEAIDCGSVALEFHERYCVLDDSYCLLLRGMAHAFNGTSDQCVRDLTAALEISPELPEIYCARGIAYALLEKYELGAEDFKQACVLCASKSHEAEVYQTLRSRCLFMMRKKLQAENELPDERSSSVWCLVGDMQFSGEKLDEALSSYTHAVERNPRLVRALYGRSKLYVRFGNVDKALEDIKHICDYRRQDLASAYDRDVLIVIRMCNRSEYYRAIKMYTKIILKPAVPGSIYSRGAVYCYRGLCYWMMSDKEYAVRDWKRALELDSTLPLLWFCFVLNSLHEGQLSEAVDSCSKLCDLVPKNARAHLLRGLLLAQIGEEHRSELAIKEVLKLDESLIEKYMKETDMPLFLDVLTDGKLTPTFGSHVSHVRVAHRVLHLRPAFSQPLVKIPSIAPDLSDSPLHTMSLWDVRHQPYPSWERDASITHHNIPLHTTKQPATSSNSPAAATTTTATTPSTAKSVRPKALQSTSSGSRSKFKSSSGTVTPRQKSTSLSSTPSSTSTTTPRTSRKKTPSLQRTVKYTAQNLPLPPIPPTLDPQLLVQQTAAPVQFDFNLIQPVVPYNEPEVDDDDDSVPLDDEEEEEEEEEEEQQKEDTDEQLESLQHQHEHQQQEQ